MKNKLLFYSLFVFSLLFISIVERSFSEDETFSIVNIEKDSGGKKVEIYLNHEMHYFNLVSWPGSKGAKVVPRVADLSWDFSYLKRNKLVLKGKFKHGQKYSIVFPKDYKLDKKSYKKVINSFTFESPPQINYWNHKTVIEKFGPQYLHLKIANTKNIHYQEISVPPVLLSSAINASIGNRNIDWNSLSQSFANNKYPARKNDVATFKNLFRKQEHKNKFFNVEKKNKSRLFSFPLGLDERKEGDIKLIRLTTDGKDENARTPIRLIRITDLGITYKQASDDLLIWITSLKEAMPIENVEIFGLTGLNRIFKLGNTDSDGIVKFSSRVTEGINLLSSDYVPINYHLVTGDIKYILAVTKDDVSYIPVAYPIYPKNVPLDKDTEKHTSRKAKLFTDRGIYRPGDTLNFKGVVREYSEGEISSPSRLTRPTIRIKDSKGELVSSEQYALSEFGSLWGSLKLENHLPLGTYQMELIDMTGRDEVLAEHTFQLQEFKAPRHFTGISFKKEPETKSHTNQWTESNDTLKVTINGNYYSGGHVKNGQVRWKIFHGPTNYNVKELGEFVFGNIAEEKFLLESSESILDDNGSLSLTFPIDPKVRQGKRSLVVVATTIDFDGRVATAKSIYQEKIPYVVGIKGAKKKIKSGDDLSLKLLVADPNRNPVQEGEIKVDILRKDWSYIRQRNNDGEVFWTYKKFWKKFLVTKTSLNKGFADFNFDGGLSGDYILKFTYSNGENTYISGISCEVKGGYYSYEYMNRDTPYDKLPIWSEKDSYQPNDQALIKIQSQKKSSSYLLTVEREGILDHQVFTSDEAGNISFPIQESYSPNVYVSILGAVPRKHFPFYRRSIDDGAPTFEFGTVKVPVVKGAVLLNVGINETEVSLKKNPQSPVTLNLSVKDIHGQGKQAELAVGVVDESVLALTGFKTPKLSELNSFTVPLSVGTQDIRRMLAHQTPFSKIRNNPLTGGGGLENSTLESVTARENFIPVAYFNPAVVTDTEGKAQVSFVLPDNITSYRIYVIANDKGSGFGSAERNLIATKEFYIEPGLPRFLTVGDKLRFPVAAFNKSDQTLDANLMLNSSEHLSLSSLNITSPIQSKNSHTFTVDGEALSTGLAEVLFSSSANDQSDSVKLKIPVNPSHTLGTEILLGSFSNSSKVMLPLPTELLNKHNHELTKSSMINLTVSSNPFIKLTGGLLYLLQYPYGCVEQTSSKVLPLAALRGLIEKGLIPDIRTAETDKYLRAGVTRLLKMQTESGGFGYWPGNKSPHRAGTLYAMAALSIARENGMNVPDQPFAKGLNYISKSINNDDLNPNETAFAAYILAMNDSLDEELFFKSQYQKINSSNFETRMFWTLAGIKSGYLSDTNLKDAIRTNQHFRLASLSSKNTNEVFNARYRSHAIGLLAFNAADPEDKFTHRIAESLFQGFGSSGRWTSTSDTGWALYALGNYYSAQESNNEPYSVKITAGSHTVDTGVINKIHKKIQLNPEEYFKNPFLELNASSNLPIYYKAVLQFPRVDYAESGTSNGFHVNKSIRNIDGSQDIRVGDLVKVTIDIEKDKTGHSRRYRYIVIDDPLPAGLVAINSSIKTEEVVPENDEDSYTEDGARVLVPSFQEIRDDRVLIFRDSNIWDGKYQYSYYARATTEGQFVLPSTKAQLMYSPQVMGLTPKSIVNIKASQIR